MDEYDVGPQGFEMRVDDTSTSWLSFCSATSSSEHFQNSQAAFQALKFWRQGRAAEFRKLSGAEAIARSLAHKDLEDLTFADLGGHWQAGLHVLRAKFRPQTDLGQALLRTEHDFLLQCDSYWENLNVLGLQLMIVRDELHCSRSGHDAQQWTPFLETLMDVDTGVPRGSQQEKVWQSIVKSAMTAAIGGKSDLMKTGESRYNCRKCDPQCFVQ